MKISAKSNAAVRVIGRVSNERVIGVDEKNKEKQRTTPYKPSELNQRNSEGQT